MPLIDSLLPEFDREMGLTRRALERVPDGQFDWKPHPTSVTLGRLAEHLTEMPMWATTTMAQRQFDASYKTARGNLLNKTDAEFAAPWTLKNGGKEVFTAPKATVMRNFVLNHMIHHRGQFVVYLRMLGVPVPSIYGPSGDEAM